MMTGGRAFALKLNAGGSVEYATYLDLIPSLNLGNNLLGNSI